MTRFHFERPDGLPDGNVQNISRHLNPFIPPQGFSVEEKGPPILVASFNAQAQLGNATGLKFNDVGTKLYIISSDTDELFQYTVPTAFNIDPAPLFLNQTFEVPNTDEPVPTGLAWSGDSSGTVAGDTLFIIGTGFDKILQYPVGSNFEVSSVGLAESNKIDTGLSVATGLSFAKNGERLYVSGGGLEGKVLEYTLSNPFDIQSGVTGPKTSTITFPDTDIRSVELSTNGDKLFVVGRQPLEKVYQYALSTAFDITTLSTSPTAEFDVSEQSDEPFGLTFSNNGNSLFIVDFTIETVFQYALPSPFQL